MNIVTYLVEKGISFLKISLVIHILPSLKIIQTILIMEKNSIITLLPKTNKKRKSTVNNNFKFRQTGEIYPLDSMTQSPQKAGRLNRQYLIRERGDNSSRRINTVMDIYKNIF